AAKVTEAIDHDSSLTDAEKKAQKQGVVTEADKAKKAIDAAGSADAVDKAKDAGIKAIDAQHQSGQAVATRKDDAKKAIDEEAAKVIKAIDQDPTLTDAEKAAQKQAVATEADKAKKAIDAAKGADAVDQAKAAGIKAIDAQHRSGQTIAAQKDVAKKAIDDEAAKVIKAIDQDPTLTDAEKAAQKQAVAAEADKAKRAIDAAGNADAVNQAKAAGIKAINDQHRAGKGQKVTKATPLPTTKAPETPAAPKTKVITSTEGNLPKTGEQQSLWMVILGALLSLFSGLWFTKKKASH
ncbi:DUF1542 domain-containing protein, partial [Lacticaseibacillus rhamnosus]